ncbi:RNA methyltransferase [Candidatus Woesearchaeota archaeon]|nr:RNA methyltransferase [Candidatus Woesearchaeota archaeon]
MLSVVLIEPKNQGNIGAVCRAMKNFGFEKLVLVNPVGDHLVDDAFRRAKHSKEILENAVVEKNIDFLESYDVVIGTTGKLGSDYNIPRTPLSSHESNKVFKRVKNKKLALVFGREEHGLTNSEIKQCDFLISIPTSKDYAVMNISHAVTIILYEASKAFLDTTITSHIKPPVIEEKKVLDKEINNALTRLSFVTPTKKNTAYKTLKKIIMRATPSKRELIALIGFFKKIKK